MKFKKKGVYDRLYRFFKKSFLSRLLTFYIILIALSYISLNNGGIVVDLICLFLVVKYIYIFGYTESKRWGK